MSMYTSSVVDGADLCIPEQSIHSSIPRFILAHFGLGALQSEHLSFPAISKKSRPREVLQEEMRREIGHSSELSLSHVDIIEEGVLERFGGN